MDPVFKQLATENGVSDAALEWLQAQGITSISKFGVLATEEKEVKAEILDMMVAGGVKFEKLDSKVSIKLLWLVCRKNMKTEECHEESNGVDTPLPRATKQDLDTFWNRVHGFTLPDAWLLVPTLQGKMWRAYNQDKPKVDALLAESLRPLSLSNRAVGTQLSIVPGKAVESQAVVIDAVGRPIELYLRIRAWMTTMAYVSIRNQNWFDFQTALFGSDKILQLVTQTFGGQYAPTAFYVGAWAATVHHFAEQVRVAGSALKDVVMNTGSWEHKWTSYIPSQAADGQRNDHASTGPDLPKEVQDEIQRLKESARQWQSSADRFRMELENLKKDGGRKDHGAKDREYSDREGKERGGKGGRRENDWEYGSKRSRSG